jgi:Ser-tRNA(Ala) deacylase AlaX
MTKKLFWEDPYQIRLNTRITRVDGNNVTVAETIFYAFASGQESDHGAIGGRRVVHARKEGKEILAHL